ncbi:hypothetical protein BCAH820_B0104 (plasmid) [Bacillus cereus AH820]|uniref:Uncharacterized protein n=1 Tax=Bacillus cereus (strain AH820) TaxID=405535 RepID=B7JTK2_BACC0|nr:hypothetical protein BCAH820_B0104 [Bacillus cereus AH820]
MFEKRTSYGKIRGHQKNVVFETRDVPQKDYNIYLYIKYI